MTAAATSYAFREGRPRDLRATFSISATAVHHTARRMGLIDGPPPTDAQIEAELALIAEIARGVAADAQVLDAAIALPVVEKG